VALVGVGLGALVPLLAPASPWRHICLVPVLAVALRFGPVGGGLAAVAVVMTRAPRLLSQLEGGGMTAAGADELIGGVALLGVAPLIGALAGAARRQRTRYETLLAVQRAVAEERSLSELLERLRALLAGPLRAAALALVVRDADRLALVGGARLAPGSVVARVLDTGAAIFVPDTGAEARARRVLAVPLLAGGDVIGALALERTGELGAGERASLIRLGVYLGLALENARLAAAQRRFNAELAEKVTAATRHLEALDRAKSAFVATVSHELRTPLTALVGFSELLATRRVAVEEVARLASIMQSESERLARLVDDLLDLSRIEHGIALRVRPVVVELAPALSGAVEVFRRGGVDHRLVLACAADLWVWADPDAVDRIVKNLVSNAIKYSPHGSAVTLSAERRGAHVEIAIADQGPGIEAEALGRIFEPYYRTAQAASTARGVGLGLAVVKALVEAHGGVIGVESAPRRGTRVAFSLPVGRPLP
jgi:signal transduction histidine kinase